ncbi:tryptophan--tRNA ligase [Candidatus Parcubacteria bacterium]|nr:MAG: tryptophan--tRNA ligase [Candidatus Parcubacteria bacterium]
MARVVTGVKPTGDLHLGHLVGLLEPAVTLAQSADEVFYFIADYHALTTVHNRDELERNVRSIAVGFLAAGVDPERVTLFRQSAVPEHSELCWILGTLTPMGLLERAHAYKDARAHNRDINAGVFMYPVLMAADILMYRAEIVPVGKDQVQHLEITRDIAQKFNNTFSQIFPLPQARVETDERAAVVGVDGRKMSKSYRNTIPLFADDDAIRSIVRRIVTRSVPEGEPLPVEGDIILSILRAVNPQEAQELTAEYQRGIIGYAQTKDRLAQAIIERIGPLRERAQKLFADPEALDTFLEYGAQKARKEAAATMKSVRDAIGLARAKAAQ